MGLLNYIKVVTKLPHQHVQKSFIKSSFQFSIYKSYHHNTSTTSNNTSRCRLSIINKLQSFIGSENVLSTPKDDITKYTTDWTKYYHGGSVVVKPSNTHEISQILKYCHEHSLSIVPQGGNTGLVGGQVGIKDDEIILSLERLNKIIKIDPIALVATMESGCILQDVNNILAKQELMLPIDLGAKGSCQLGGNIATNAGR